MQQRLRKSQGWNILKRLHLHTFYLLINYLSDGEN
jgi:hypothetical protein